MTLILEIKNLGQRFKEKFLTLSFKLLLHITKETWQSHNVTCFVIISTILLMMEFRI